MKITLIIIGSFIGLILLAALGSALNLVTIPWLKFNRQVQMNRDIIDRTYDANNALAQYHWFQEQKGVIEATYKQGQIAHMSVAEFEGSAGERKNWTFEDKNEDSRLRAVEQGIKSHYEELVTAYNAKAKETDRAIFKDELPTFFSLQPF